VHRTSRKIQKIEKAALRRPSMPITLGPGNSSRLSERIAVNMMHQPNGGFNSPKVESPTIVYRCQILENPSQLSRDYRRRR
jgi:hypothetical protein